MVRPNLFQESLVRALAGLTPHAQAFDDGSKLLDAHVDMLEHAAVKHGKGHSAVTTLSLRVREHAQHDPLLACEPIARVGQIVVDWNAGRTHA